jgi:hypothetical protein
MDILKSLSVVLQYVAMATRYNRVMLLVTKVKQEPSLSVILNAFFFF